MKKLITLLLLFIASFMNAQRSTVSSAPADLFQCWSASYEEDEANSMTKSFRLCDYDKFPPSRFRQQLQFGKDGMVKILNVGATDAHFYSDHKFTYNKKKKLVTVLDDKGKAFMRFKLNSVAKDKLKLTHIEIK
jgi:hypothetical protein